jgi:hypothetical protein
MDLSELKAGTAQHLVTYAGLEAQDAGKLVDALCQAAQGELLTMVSGSEPYPSSMTDLRALRLRYICQAAERLLSPREVAILFKTTDSGAQTLLTRMERLYPAAVDRYLDRLVATAGRFDTDGDAEHPRVIFYFPQLGAWEHAIAKLERAGATDIQRSKAGLTIETPKLLPSREAAQHLLGIPDSAKRK